MSARRTSPRRTTRTLSALALALLVGSTAAPVAARPGITMIDPAAASGTFAGDGPDELPSVHWLHDQEHADEVLTFEPGERVTVPFTPRADDTWEIDGKPPKALPAGHASGKQMRDAPQGSVWADGEPGRSEAAGPPAPDVTTDNGVDQPTGEADAVADPASVSGSTAAAGDGEVLAAPIGPSGLRREVFGYLPYWELHDSSTVLDWRVLSTVAWFSVGCRSDGDLAKRKSDGSVTTGWAGWTSSKMTSIINAAHQHQARVVMSVSCFAWSSSNAQTQASLLGSSIARANLAKQIAAAVRDRGADGVNLDFEPIVSGYADEYVSLIRRVRTELNNVAPGYQLTFATMGSIGNQPIVDGTAAGAADALFIMGYDYRTAGANYAGSISPLTGPIYDLTDTIKAYTAKISPSKIILGVPWYGRAWSTGSDSLHAATLSPSKYGASAAPFYADAMDLLSANGRRWDSVEQAPWTAYRKQTCTSTYGCVTSWRQLYVDDAASIKLRYDFINRQSLRGVGIWALGYDDGRTEMRTALADKFLADKSPPIVGTSTFAPTQRDEGFKVSWKSWDDSSIAGYDIDVSVNGGAWARWLTGTKSTSAIYLGTEGRTYAFRARGADIHGNVSAWNTSIALASLSAPASITVGGFATVLVDGLRMRASASTGASTMATLAAGDALQVVGGPSSGEGYTWFQVTGPIKQWPPVDQPQVGGWVAVSGNGATNVGPRRPVYATKVDAAVRGVSLNEGGARVLTPNGDGIQDRLRIEWTNDVALDSLKLRVHRLDGTVAGTLTLAGTTAGAHAFLWDGRLGGVLVPTGGYVIQLQGLRGSTTYNAPSAAPASADQIARFGVMVGPVAPTNLLAFKSTTPTNAAALTYSLTFGGPISGLKADDFVRTGTATGCVVGTPSGAGAAWTVVVSGCSAGTVGLGLRAGAVADAVRNWGPASQKNAATVLIDRTKPTTSAPKVSLRAGVSLSSTSTAAKLPVTVTWTGSDAGGAGLRDYDVRRSRDGGAWTDVAVDTTATSVGWNLVPGHTYRFDDRARDKAGNVGAWVAGPTISPVLRQNSSTSITWGGTWKPGTSTSYSGGTVRYSTVAGSSARYSFTGRGVALVTTLRPDGGKVKVYIDGTYVTTIDTASATTVYRRVVYSKTWSSAGTHTLRLVVVGGTTGHARVDLDAVAALK